MAAKKKSTSAKTKKAGKQKTAKNKKAVSAKMRPATRRPATATKKNAKKKSKKTSASKNVTSAAKPNTKKTTAKKTATKKTAAKKTVAKQVTPNPNDNTARTNPEQNENPPPRRTKKTWLSKDELATFEKMLLEKRAELVGNVQGLSNEALRKNRSESSGDVSTMPTHMADLGSDNWEQEFTLGLIETEQSLLREIDDALKRINDRTYGICLASNTRILKTRLKAKPWAKYCIEYARKKELGLV